MSVVIPAYNEERRLGATLDAWVAFLEDQPYAAEVVVSDDGSTDGTPSVALDVAGRAPLVRLVRLAHNHGKGGAVKAGVLSAKGDVVLVVDADLNISPDHVPPMLRLMDGGADVVVGCRSLREYASEEKSVARVCAGAAVQVTRRALAVTSLRDTQCGFKAYRHELGRHIFEQTRIRSFAYDIEALYLARRLGARIEELPVSVVFRGDSTYNLRKHLPPFLRDIWRIRANALRGRYG